MSSANIPFTLSQVAQTAIGNINADATFSNASSSNAMIFAGVIVSPKGAPFQLLSVTKENWQGVTGTPYHSSVGIHSESLRHVGDAVNGGNGVLVRVVPSNATYPVIHILPPPPAVDENPRAAESEVQQVNNEPVVLSIDDLELSTKIKNALKKPGHTLEELRGMTDEQLASIEGIGESSVEAIKTAISISVRQLSAPAPVPLAITKEAVVYGQEPELSEADTLMLWIVDGAESGNRKFSLTPADAAQYGEGMYKLTLTETDSVGYDRIIDSYYVSLTFGAKDDMGNDVYIETLLESKSKVLRAQCAADTSAFTSVEDVVFDGASNGDLASITPEDYKKAVSLLASSVIKYTGVCALGIYDEETLKSLITIANNRRIGLYADVDPRKTYAEACTWKEAFAISECRAMFYHFPFTALDPYHRNRNIWGLSGVAFTAKAKGVAKNLSPGGWHLTPAGEERALINRTRVKPNMGLDEPDYERMYKCRINKLDSNALGQLFIDDSLTSYTRENYLRFEQQVAVTDAACRDLYALFRRLKHEPDGVTEDGLNEGISEILDGYVYSKALVKPRDPDDGDEPYKYTLTQGEGEPDLWKLELYLCVTGSFRRGYIDPILMR